MRVASMFRGAGLLIAVTLAGCGSTASSANSAPLNQAQAGTLYLSDVAPVREASAAFVAAQTGWTLQTTAQQVSAATLPVIAAEQRFDSELSATAWPTNAETDVRTLIAENERIVSALQQAPELTLATISAWKSTLVRDTDVDFADSNLVRSDLGLPRATS